MMTTDDFHFQRARKIEVECIICIFKIYPAS